MQYRAALSQDQPRQEHQGRRRRISTRTRSTPRVRSRRRALRAIREGAAQRQRAGFRRSAARSRPPAAARRRHPRGLQSPLELRHDRRVSGHQPQPVRADAPADRAAPQCLRGGRRRPVDLQLARRGYPQHSGFRARLSQRQDHPPGAELPLDQEHSGGGQRRGGEQQGAQGQEAVDRGRRRRPDRAVRGLRRRKRSAVHRRHHREVPGAQSRRSRGGSLPHQLAIAADRRGAAALRPQVQRGRRLQLLPARRNQGYGRVSEAGGVEFAIRSACCASSTRRRAASGARRWSRSSSYAPGQRAEPVGCDRADARRPAAFRRDRNRRW